MSPHALMVIADEPGTFHWVLLEVDGRHVDPLGSSTCQFDSYAAALNDGTVALAAADGQPYENEAADPVGDADCAAAVAPLG